jgi:hypothetical protein
MGDNDWERCIILRSNVEDMPDEFDGQLADGMGVEVTIGYGAP